jgi:CRISPR-associated endonuclease/helicase Cas3
MRSLSKQASSLWGKSDYGEGERWLPLFVHMLDAAGIAGCLWDQWVPEGTRGIVAEALGGDAGLARRTFVFLAGIHDIGKATPYFQFHNPTHDPDAIPSWKPTSAGLSAEIVIGAAKPPSHSVASDVVLRSLLSGTFDEFEYVSLGAIVGNHHGVPPTSEKTLRSSEIFESVFGLCAEDWKSVQEELLQMLEDHSGLGGESLSAFADLVLPAQVESVLSGLVILSDWISSNQDLFPLLDFVPEDEESRAIQGGRIDAGWFGERLEEGWRHAGLPPCWQEDGIPELGSDAVFRQRFHLPDSYGARPVQEAAARIASDCANPGIVLIEAPTGEGKTEAALEAAEILAVREGRGGVVVALPTMATTDAMFGRVRSWLDTLPQSSRLNSKSTYLAHGKARLNEEFQGLVHEARDARYGIGMDEEREGPNDSGSKGDAIVSEWLMGRKRGLLSNFVMCTIDQVLMSALQMKHVSLRQLSLANKVVIIDECHAYDAYMLEYLKRTLEWLGSWNSPVILLSATLPPDMKEELLGAYLQGKSWSHGRHSELGADAASIDGYPIITYSDGLELKATKVRQASESVRSDFRLIGDSDQELLELLSNLLEDGGCAGVICDTVRRAQESYEVLVEGFGRENVCLIHSRFLDVDRMEKENVLRRELGPGATRANGGRPALRIVVGTQVLEQSLDIDFDVLVSDIAPIDLLIQRLGRSHRHAVHDAGRPKRLSSSVCYLRGIEDWKDGVPAFSKGINRIYETASLLEALSILGLTEAGSTAEVETPQDVPSLIRSAYKGIEEQRLPESWAGPYKLACENRAKHVAKKQSDAQSYLLRSVCVMDKKELSIEDWFSIGLKSDERHGSRAVRDSDEALEVIVLEDDGNGLRLLPWVGSERDGIRLGAEVPLDSTPSYRLACVISESTVRIPKGILRTVEDMEKAIEELEDACSSRLGAWEESGMLAGQLVMAMHRSPSSENEFETTLCGKRILYSKTVGLFSDR